jgi:hypothetical protein
MRGQYSSYAGYYCGENQIGQGSYRPFGQMIAVSIALRPSADPFPVVLPGGIRFPDSQFNWYGQHAQGLTHLSSTGVVLYLRPTSMQDTDSHRAGLLC